MVGGGAMSRPRIIVCGGRQYTNRVVIERALWALLRKHGPFVLVHGDCRGADRTAEAMADIINAVEEDNGGDPESIEVERHPADWRAHGRRAGPLRNRHMASLGAIGCVAFPGQRGTASMVDIAKNHGIPVWDLRNGTVVAP